MKIASLTLDGVLGAPDGTYSFRLRDGSPAPVVVVRGDEASGKTSLLRAIAALKEQGGAYGAPPRPSSLLRRGRATGRLSATWVLNEAERRLAKLDGADHTVELVLDDAAVQPLVHPGLRALFARSEPSPGIGRLELVPSIRYLDPRAELAEGVVDVARRARDEGAKYAGLAGWILERATHDGSQALRAIEERGVLGSWERPDSLAPLRDSLATLLPHLRLRGAETTDAGLRVEFERRAGGSIDLLELSRTEQDAVLLALVVHRYALEHGLVLLDEPTPGLSTHGARARFAAVCGLATDMQVVATSTGDALTGSMPQQVDIPLPMNAGAP